MSNLEIEATRNTPLIRMNADGNFLIEGKIIAEDSVSLFEPVINWVSEFSASNVEFKINLYYLNTSASKHLFTVLRMLDENEKIDSIKIKWYYEEDDEDHLEVGEYFEDSLGRAEFEYFAVREEEAA